MPPVVAGVAAAVGALAAGTTVFGLTVGLSAVVIGLGTTALAFASQALTPKPKAASLGFVEAERGYQTMVRSPVEPQRLVYGTRVVSGPLVYAATSGNNNRLLHLVVPLAGHRSREIGTVWFNQHAIYPDQIAANGDVIAGRFKDKARIRKHLGADDEEADSSLVNQIDEWTEDHRGQGITYLYVRLDFDRDVYPLGIPNIKAEVRGRLVCDWRDTPIAIASSSADDQSVIETETDHNLSVGERVFIWGHDGSDPDIRGEYDVLSVPTSDSFTIHRAVTTGGTGGFLLPMTWSDNAAFATSDYAVTDYGPKDDPDEDFSVAAAAAAANISDEEVGLASSTPTFNVTASASDDILTQDPPPSGERYKPLHFGDGVEFTSTGSLPAGLDAETRYFAIPIGKKTFQVAASLDDARAGNAIDISSAGSGTHTLTRKSQPRYTANGVVQLTARPIDVIPDLVGTMAGAMVFTQGLDTLYAGAYTGPAAVQVDESDLRAKIKWRSLVPKSSLFNIAAGQFVDRDDYWQTGDVKPQRSTEAIAEDGGEEIVKEFELPFVTDQARAQRLLRLALRRARESLTVDYPAKMTALQIGVMETIGVSIDKLGFDEKEFQVMSWHFGEDGGIDLALKETHPGIYAWDPDADEVTINFAENTNLPDPFTVPPPTVLALSSGDDALDQRIDGTIFSRIRATWTSPEDASVTTGGSIEIAYRKSGGTWRESQFVRGNQTEWFALDVADGVAYDVAQRAISRLGVRSDPADDPATWQSIVTDHVVLGKSALPDAPDSLRAFQNGSAVLFKIKYSPAADFDHYELRFQPRGAGHSFDDQTPIDDQTLRREMTTVSIPPGDWTFEVRAVDTSRNRSAGGATADLVVANVQNVVISNEQWPLWPGLGSGSSAGFVRNPLTGNLNPSSDDSASTVEEFFSAYAFNPPAEAIYEAAEIDIGGDTDARVWSTITSDLGPGEAGVAAPDFEIDYRVSTGAYDGFEDWSIGSLTGRYIKARLVADLSQGLVRVSRFDAAVDIEEREETGQNVPIAMGGTPIVFSRPFLQSVHVELTNTEDAARFVAATSVTLSGFTAKVWDSGGSPVAGTVNWRAQGA